MLTISRQQTPHCHGLSSHGIRLSSYIHEANSHFIKILFVEESECYIWKRKSEEIFHSRHVHIINMRIGNAVNCRGTPAGLGRHAWCN
ncbi:hypothetical protein T03_11495 [Trichinella britovi]|uniref:Uncharacterized protein n=1 Tax=Trichinella britovi TaxID=45882 RepID=A0A0V1D8D3_TRIBR|nr:hypothetical protein T03_11495 [Trichinella britovi]KRZ90523.1 hypothetical protein T08_7705 [Trichinella sp. T8]